MELSPNAKKILDILPEDGSQLGKFTIIKKTGMSDEEYRSARSELKSSSLVVGGYGYGGTLRRKIVSVETTARPSSNNTLTANTRARKGQTKLTERILRALPPDGSMVGNTTVIRELNIKPEDFFRVKNLLDEKKSDCCWQGKRRQSWTRQTSRKTH